MAKDFSLSIGVNGFNEKASVKRMLESVFKSRLWKQTPRDKRELVFVSDCSTDGTAEIVRRMKAEHPEIKVIELKNPPKGLNNFGNAAGRNLLTQRMSKKADILFFFDADVILRRGTLDALKNALVKNSNIDAAAAELKPAAKGAEKKRQGPFQRLSVSRFEKRKKSDLEYISGAGYAIRGDTIRKIKIPEELRGNVDVFLTLKVGPKRILRVKEEPIIFRDRGSLNDYRKWGLRHFFSSRQLREYFPGMTGAKIRQVNKAFLAIPRRPVVPAAAAKAAEFIGRVQGRVAWRMHKRGKKVNPWPKTTGNGLGRKQRRR